MEELLEPARAERRTAGVKVTRVIESFSPDCYRMTKDKEQSVEQSLWRCAFDFDSESFEVYEREQLHNDLPACDFTMMCQISASILPDKSGTNL
ncbi:hypothetical protein RB195_015688 [Necator americanus]|uniref:Uncharacterized protein n=1 Tax=Necator americanus TaxID=51031 RepID=A0ABR1E6W7_NECAM